MVETNDSALLAGGYERLGTAGIGGMATVLVARAPRTSTKVAVKLLHPFLANDVAARTALVDEARLAVRIAHPNVVRVHDLLDLGEGQAPALVLEWIDGLSLAQLAARGRVPNHVAVAIACDVLEGLHAAHEAVSECGAPLGIVHRDVSPQNVLVGKDGVARITDFGIAKTALSGAVADATSIQGKLGYMAPEQLGGAVDRRADVYGVGAMLWELVTARPFRDVATAGAAVLVAILHGSVTAPSAFDPAAAVVERVILRALARDADDRFATARDMAEALRACVTPATVAEVAAFVSGEAPAPVEVAASHEPPASHELPAPDAGDDDVAPVEVDPAIFEVEPPVAVVRFRPRPAPHPAPRPYDLPAAA